MQKGGETTPPLVKNFPRIIVSIFIERRNRSSAHEDVSKGTINEAMLVFSEGTDMYRNPCRPPRSKFWTEMSETEENFLETLLNHANKRVKKAKERKEIYNTR